MKSTFIYRLVLVYVFGIAIAHTINAMSPNKPFGGVEHAHKPHVQHGFYQGIARSVSRLLKRSAMPIELLGNAIGYIGRLGEIYLIDGAQDHPQIAGSVTLLATLFILYKYNVLSYGWRWLKSFFRLPDLSCTCSNSSTKKSTLSEVAREHEALIKRIRGLKEQVINEI